MRRASVSIATAASGSARQPSDTPRVVVACSSQMAAGGLAGTRDADGVAGELLGHRERALQHPELGQPGHDRGARDRRRRRDELHRAPASGDRALGIAGHPPELAEPVVDQAEAGPVLAGIGRADRRVEVGRRPDRSIRGERRFGGADREIGRALAFDGRGPGRGTAGRSRSPGRPRRSLRGDRQLQGGAARRPASRRLRPDPPPRSRPGRPPAHRARSGSGASP